MAARRSNGKLAKRGASGIVFASRHDGCVEALAQVSGELIYLVGAVDFYRLARGVENHLAVPALVHMLLDLGAQFRGHAVVDQVVEEVQKLSAGHLSTPSPLLGDCSRLRRK